MNLFKKIWNKNFLKAKEPIDKFSEDIGGIKGEFSWIKYKNGQQIETFSHHNEITGLSKSTVVRLLAQGTSSWTGNIDANLAQYRISKMRFGNAPYSDHNTNLPLCYYALDEIVYRNNLTYSASTYSPAGGRYVIGAGTPAGTITSNIDSDVQKDFLVTGGIISNWTAGANISINISTTNFPGISFNLQRPPSHKSFSIQLLNSSNSVLSTLTFDSIYSRSSVGNNPTQLVQNVQYLNTTLTNHKLFYVYPTGTETSGYWKLQFQLGNGTVADVTKVRVKFKIGSFNIVNSIVPKTGYNAGFGNASERFPLSSGIDFYSTVSPVYNNSEGSSFIDDYSATFSVTMASNEGNGVSTFPVYYTEAFLFNQRDDLFSIIRFPFPSNSTPKGFEKSTDYSYLISWTIKSIT